MSTDDTYRSFAKFYDQYVERFTEDLPLYRQYCQDTHRILEVGCGTGRVLKYLAEAGCKIFGVDISEDMLKIAKGKLGEYIASGKVRLANFNFLEGHLNETFDRVLVTFYTINYLLKAEDCRDLLNNVYQSMDASSTILIDAFFPRPLEKTETSDVWSEKELQIGDYTLKLKDKRRMEGLVEERIQEYMAEDFRETIVTHRRYYSKQEIHKILEECGFANIRFTDGYVLGAFHELNTTETVRSSFIIKAEKT